MTVINYYSQPYHPTLVAAFNHPRWVKIQLTDKQRNAVVCQLKYSFSDDRQTASHYVTYPDGAIPMDLEVFRVTGNDYFLRLGVDIPGYLSNLLGGSVMTDEGPMEI